MNIEMLEKFGETKCVMRSSTNRCRKNNKMTTRKQTIRQTNNYFENTTMKTEH